MFPSPVNRISKNTGLDFFETGPNNNIIPGGHLFYNTNGQIYEPGQTVHQDNRFCKMTINHLNYKLQINPPVFNFPIQLSLPKLKPAQDALESEKAGTAWRFPSRQGGYSISAKEAHATTTRDEDRSPMLPPLSFFYIIGPGLPHGSLGGLFGGFLLLLSPLRFLQSHSSPGVAGNVVRHMPRRGGIGSTLILPPHTSTLALAGIQLQVCRMGPCVTSRWATWSGTRRTGLFGG